MKIAHHRFSLRRSVSPMAVIALSLFVACSSQAAGTSPDDMAADDHHAEAEAHEATAEEHRKKYDEDARAARVPASSDPTRADFFQLEYYNPTQHHLRESERHQEHARQHREAGETLLAFEEEHCEKFPAETRAECPLMGQVEEVEDVERGVQLNFREDVPLTAAKEHMKCHFAFARTEG